MLERIVRRQSSSDIVYYQYQELQLKRYISKSDLLCLRWISTQLRCQSDPSAKKPKNIKEGLAVVKKPTESEDVNPADVLCSLTDSLCFSQ